MDSIQKGTGQAGFSQNKYPENYILSGNEPNENALKIFIDGTLLEEINSYLTGDTNIEMGGVLIGNVFKNSQDIPFVIIENFIVAQNTKSNLTRLTFTHQTWDYINTEKEKYYRDNIIVGWFHSHPGHKVFLSGYDIFIQQNFFNEIYSIAYVYDPVNDEKGFFIWSGSGIVRTEGFYLTNPVLNEKTKYHHGIQNVLSQNINKDMDSDKTNNFKSWLILVLVCLNLILLLILCYNLRNTAKELQTVKENLNILKTINTNIDKMDLKINELMLGQPDKKDSASTLLKK